MHKPYKCVPILNILKQMFGTQTFIKNEIVMKMEKMNMPPRPYKCNVRLPIRSMSGIEINVIITIIQPIPIVANLALSRVNPDISNKFVE